MSDQGRDAESVARSLPNGGYPVAEIGTAGQFDQEHVSQLANAGYRTVLDLRGADEPRGFDERGQIGASGMKYINLPIKSPVADDVFDRAREILNQPDNRPLLIHCGTANRVGAIMLPHLVLDRGESPAEALRIASDIGLRSPELRDAALRYVSSQQAG